MPNPDQINAIFEFTGALFLLLNIRRLWVDKRVQGVSVWPVMFWSAWGFWNLLFYPYAGLMWSFYGALCVVTANCVWLSMLVWFWGKGEDVEGLEYDADKERAARQADKMERVVEHRDDWPLWNRKLSREERIERLKGIGPNE